LERGKTWTFASALDWPGWCRRAKGGDEAALEALAEYGDRYARITGRAGLQFEVDDLRVVASVAGDMTTDFGAPGIAISEESDLPDRQGAARLASLLAACWKEFDEIAALAPEHLRKGPRGGGRDRDEVVDHVRESERNYTRTIGVRVAPRTPWPDQRAAILAGITTAGAGTSWPLRYYVRRTAWHVTDHAWEIEDRQ
jgi:hypothetical protein